MCRLVVLSRLRSATWVRMQWRGSLRLNWPRRSGSPQWSTRHGSKAQLQGGAGTTRVSQSILLRIRRLRGMYLRNCRFVLFCETQKGLGSLKVISFSNFCLKNPNTFCTPPEILKQSNTVLPDNILRQGLSVLFKTLKASQDVLASKTFVKIAFECAQRCLKTTKGPITKPKTTKPKLSDNISFTDWMFFTE